MIRFGMNMSIISGWGNTSKYRHGRVRKNRRDGGGKGCRSKMKTEILQEDSNY